MRNTLLMMVLCFFVFQSIGQNDGTYWEHKIYFQIDPILNIQLPPYSDATKHTAYQEIPELAELVAKEDVSNVSIAFPGLKTPIFNNLYRVEFNEEIDPIRMAAALSKSPKLAFAEAAPKNYPCLVPNDPLIMDMWFLPNVQAPEAWDIIDPKEDVVVAIADDAVLWNHEDLQDNLWINIEESNGVSGVDDDGNGYVDDIIGWDGAENDNNPSPPSNATEGYFNHGTHVAGTAGAVTDNNRGIAAISFNNASIMACKGGRDSDAAFSGILEALAYAISNNAAVINNSWGRGLKPDGSPPNPVSNTENALFEEAEAKGLIVVFAAGNENNITFMPAEHESVIAVAATGNAFTLNPDEKASYSNYGPWVDISAPGTQIMSCVPGSSKYANSQGTSMATPNVSSLLALMKSHAPDLNKEQIMSCLYSSADNVDADNPDHIGLLGAGRINVLKAIECVSEDVEICDVSEDLDVGNITETTASLSWDNVSGAEGYNVEIKRTNSSSWFPFDGNPFTSNSLNVTGLETCVDYEFRVQTVCQDSDANFSNAFEFTTDCPSGGSEEECVEYQALYTNFQTGGDCANTPITGGFEAWANEAYLVADCNPGQSYTFTICDGYDPSVWEALLTVANFEGGVVSDVYASAEGCLLEFQIPSSESGPVDIIIVIADANDCGGEYNQTDNGIPILDCVNDCEIPGGLSVAGVQANQVTLQWIATSDAEAYNLQAKRIADTDWDEGLGLTSTAIDYTNLAPCTMYEFKVAAICNGVATAYSPTFNFETDGCNTSCDQVVNVNVSNEDDNSADVSWNSTTGADKYEIAYKNIESNSWLTDETSSTSFDLEGLTACINYELQVTAVCGSEISEPSEKEFFETDCGGCSSPDNIRVLGVTGDRATIIWDQNSSHLSYELRAREKDTDDWSDANLTTTTVNYTGLMECTEYEIQINAICSDGESGYSQSIFFLTKGCATDPDCISYGINSNDEWIESVSIGDLNNTSGLDYGYAFFDQFNQVSFHADETIDLTLTPGYRDTEYSEYWRIWIDLNRDGDFTDANELVFDADDAEVGQVQSSFNMPSNVSAGESFMRVAMKYVDSNDASAPTACTSFNYGEVEDYLIFLDPMVASEDVISLGYEINPNPINDLMSLHYRNEASFVEIFNVQGTRIQDHVLDGSGQWVLSQIQWPAGLYIVRILDRDRKVLFTESIIKH